MQTKPDWKNLIEKLSNGSDVDVVEAAKALTNYPHQDCVTSLLEFIKSEQSAFRKELAVYALAYMHNPQLTDIFTQILRNTLELDNIRGQAAEGLGNLFSNQDEKSQCYQEAEAGYGLMTIRYRRGSAFTAVFAG